MLVGSGVKLVSGVQSGDCGGGWWGEGSECGGGSEC